MADGPAKSAMRKWPTTTRIWSHSTDILWLKAQPVPKDKPHPKGPRLVQPGSTALSTTPDGLWVATDSVAYCDAVVVEASSNQQNIRDKRSRYASATVALCVEMTKPWLLERVKRQGKGGTWSGRWGLLGLFANENEVTDVCLPVRYLRVLYAVPRALFDKVANSLALEAHEYLVGEPRLNQRNSQIVQEFFRRMSPYNRSLR